MKQIVREIARNGHFTIPREIRKLLGIKDGDFVKLAVRNGQIVVTPLVFVNKDQRYFFSPECQKEIKESEEAFKKGDFSTYKSVEDLKKDIEG
ncbi:MAG: AbrB/MazE/SpoVT family DNA-binding domain-containing protein [Candidatus Omnitrophota bacterium]